MNVTFGKILILFVLLPFLELYLLLQLSALTSPIFTFTTIILTGFLGAFLAKQQGQKVYKRIQTELQQGRVPGDNLVHGLCILVGGILLLTPGVLSDLTGLLLILPISRQWLTRWIKRQFSGFLQKEVVHIYASNHYSDSDSKSYSYTKAYTESYGNRGGADPLGRYHQEGKRVTLGDDLDEEVEEE